MGTKVVMVSKNMDVYHKFQHLEMGTLQKGHQHKRMKLTHEQTTRQK